MVKHYFSIKLTKKKKTDKRRPYNTAVKSNSLSRRSTDNIFKFKIYIYFDPTTAILKINNILLVSGYHFYNKGKQTNKKNRTPECPSTERMNNS